jgi:hypothetical protein
MRNFTVTPAILAGIMVLTGCATFQSDEPVSPETAMARQNVKLYEVIPPYGKPIGQISATACNGTQDAATDKLLVAAQNRGSNGLAQLTCYKEGFSFSCFSSTTCSGIAISVAPPPPPPPVMPPKHKKPRIKKKPVITPQ